MIKAPLMMTLTGSSPEVKIRWTMIKTEPRPNRWTVLYEVLLIYDFEKLTQRSHWRSYRMAQKPKTPLKSPKKWDPPELALNKTWLYFIHWLLWCDEWILLLNVRFSLSFLFTQILTDCYHHRLCTWNQHNQETFQWHKISFEWGNTKEEIQHRQEFFLQHSSKGSNNLEPSWFHLQNPVQDTRIYLWSKDILRLLRFYKCLNGP